MVNLLPFALGFAKQYAVNFGKYILMLAAAIIAAYIFYKISSFYRYHSSLIMQNYILEVNIKEGKRELEERDTVIRNYKKILETQIKMRQNLTNVHQKKIEKIETSADVEKVNKTLNCHIENFKNLEVICD